LGNFLDNMDIIPYSCTWEQFPSANVITGGTIISVGSMKRKFEELMSVNLLVPSNSNIGARPPLASTFPVGPQIQPFLCSPEHQWPTPSGK